MNMQIKSNKKTQKTILLLILTTILLALTACNSPASSNVYTENGIFFDTIISITIYGQDEDQAAALLDDSFKIAESYENLFSYNMPQSDIYRLNHANGVSTQVSPVTLSLIKKSLHYSDVSQGLYDITIYPASSLWDFHDTANPTLPDSALLSEAIQHIDYKNIVIDEDNSSIRLTDSKSSIDIGGIAKGFIGDEIASYLVSHSVTSAIINLGGDIKAIGCKENGKPYTIGITDPINGGSPIITLNIKDSSVATSGTYERAFEVDGHKYHHILNPKTGYPIDSDIISATVITGNAADADTLCTVTILLGLDNALKLINSLPDTEAIFITTDGTIIKSDRADDYIKR